MVVPMEWLVALTEEVTVTSNDGKNDGDEYDRDD